ncbi:bumetanide-sensitive sodium-(potassium)-chloride cotransporter-like isoform X2 [Artemia franciscana]|uniref:bumetanide-sensitive sodium-(potassium)-chloride cotransporter-like isoform X2 n=1 Tax=Artemia franciscana TaxID=6661 RepID=UPI0032DB3B93
MDTDGSKRSSGGTIEVNKNNPDVITLHVPGLVSTTNSDNTSRSRNSSFLSDKSWHHHTQEALPRLDNYKNLHSYNVGQRPTLEELYDPSLAELESSITGLPDGGGQSQSIKFGWIRGVLVRCLLCIWGVMLFLRLSWVVGQSGILEAVLIILLASVVTTITTLSMSAISTNGAIKGGGTYYMTSRSLGPEFGASIGVIFSIANAVSVAMYIVGFCESMNDLLKRFGVQIVDGGINDVRIIGAITLVGCTIIVLVGMEWEAKAQIFLLGMLVIAIVDFFIGAFIGPTNDEEIARGFLGWNGTLFSDNFVSDYREDEGVYYSFFSVFAVFFPAATGILAGANISGDLKDASSALPKGTLLSILISTIVYVAFAFFCGATVARDATGNVTGLADGSFLDCMPNECDWGLHNSFQVIETVSAFGPLIFAGCFAATLSSALASYVSAPKIFQAVCNDNLYPGIGWFGKGYGKNNEPIRAYVLTFIIALAGIALGELNAISPLISNFFLAAYALVNFSTFHVNLIKPLGWRPTFRYYNGWVSLFGALLCIFVMFLMSWVTALITFAAFIVLYLVIVYRKPEVNWGSSTQAQTYKSTVDSVYQLLNLEEHVKNYRPQILVLTGHPASRTPLVDFANLICKKQGFMLCGHVSKETFTQRQREAITRSAYGWLKAHKIRSFYTLLDSSEISNGVSVLIQSSGLGKMRPNIVMMGFMADWTTRDPNELSEYFEGIHAAFSQGVAVAILRAPQGLDFSDYIRFLDGVVGKSVGSPRMLGNGEMPKSGIPNPAFEYQESVGSMDSIVSVDEKAPQSKTKKKKDSTLKIDVSLYGENVPKNILENLTVFRRKQPKGFIDVWWLYDDGGLSVLLPYIMTTRKAWKNSKLRIFCIANKRDEIDIGQKGMAALLSKFRIDYSDVIAVSDVNRSPSEETKQWFNDLIKPSLQASGSEDHNKISKSELLEMKDKCNRHMRLRELLLQHSKDSNMVFMTLPIPKRGVVSAALYMSWMETLTKDMPPFLLVRGNQTSVLTFYS